MQPVHPHSQLRRVQRHEKHCRGKGERVGAAREGGLHTRRRPRADARSNETSSVTSDEKNMAISAHSNLRGEQSRGTSENAWATVASGSRGVAGGARIFHWGGGAGGSERGSGGGAEREGSVVSSAGRVFGGRAEIGAGNVGSAVGQLEGAVARRGEGEGGDAEATHGRGQGGAGGLMRGGGATGAETGVGRGKAGGGLALAVPMVPP